MERLRTANERRASDPLDALNEQEHKIIELIAEGKTNKEIAAEVFLSDKTVKNYVSSILTKLNLRRRSEAAAFIARREPPQSR
jgi:DNA-binding NarL/FixJ family response regulator